MRFIYLASPYSTPAGKQPLQTMGRRAAAVQLVVQRLLTAGADLYYSPIAYFHPIAHKYTLPRDGAFWWKLNEKALRMADELWVVTLPGYLESMGVAQEIQFMEFRDAPIRYIDPKTLIVR